MKIFHHFFIISAILVLVFSFIFFSPGNPAQADISSGLIGYWNFDETSGISVADSSGNSNIGTLTNGPTWTTGKINNAVSFDGVDDYVAVNGSPTFASNQGTIGFWYKPTSLTQNWDLIHLWESQFSDYLVIRQINYRNGGIQVAIEDGDISRVNATTLIGVADTNWHHIVVTQDGGGTKIYIDGALVSVDGTNGTYWTGHLTPSQLKIGNGSWNRQAGLIDDVRIYNRALSLAEIQELYNYTGGGTPPPSPVCGDFTCNGTETCSSCSQDCGFCPAGDTQAPSIPTNLTATAVLSSQINLSWSASTDNVGVTGYRVERCQGSTCTNFSQIATPTQTSYNDIGLTANTDYRYRVRATDAVSNLSDYSNIGSATTQQQQQGGNVVTAASGSAQAIQSAINSIVAAGGGTVMVPAGTWTWASGDRVCIRSSVELRVKGAGQNQTIIQYANGQGPGSSSTCGTGYSGYGQSIFEFHGSGFKEFADMTISGASDIGVPVNLYVRAAQGMTNVRVHHASFKKATGSFIYWIENKNSVGLIDHVYIGDKAGTGAYGIRLHGSNLESDWVKPVNFGANDGVFIEDSTFNGTYHPVAGHGTAKYTVRYNTFSNHSSALEGHGPSYGFGGISDTGGSDQPCYSGVYRVEVYNNTFNAAGYSTFQRSGHWIITDNIYKDQTQYSGPIVVEIESASIGTNCNIANSCPRASGWAGMGCNAAGKPGCWHNPQASYIWNNVFINTGGTTSICRAQANDKSCTVINDKSTGCVRESKEVFFRAPLSGDPEIAGAYTKFTYPHPLSSGGQSLDTTPPASPTGVIVI